jgi:hypothetical protein
MLKLWCKVYDLKLRAKVWGVGFKINRKVKGKGKIKFCKSRFKIKG